MLELDGERGEYIEERAFFGYNNVKSSFWFRASGKAAVNHNLAISNFARNDCFAYRRRM